MSTENAAPPPVPASQEQGGGLLSKVVKFVSNPTKDWKELESRASPSQQSSTVADDLNAQQLRERIERKRRNDFIRKAEFAHLRKIINTRKKQRQPNLSASVLAQLASAQASGVDSSVASRPVKSRSGTLEKINEIEAQLSKQWWQAGHRDGDSQLAQEPHGGHEGVGAEGVEAPSDFFMGSSSLFFVDEVAQHVRQARQDMEAGQTAAVASSHWVGLLRQMDEVLEFFGFQENFVHQADLEEAAILFASHRVADAEKVLVDVIRKHANGDPQSQVDIWMTLFDLYRAIGTQDRFDAVALDFAKRFERSAPTWISLPEQLGMAQEDKDHKRPLSWTSPPEVALQTVTTLSALQERASSPYQLGWGRLTLIQPDAVDALTDFFNRLGALPGVLKFVSVEKLNDLLAEKTVVSDASVDARWWLLRLAVIQLMGDADQFELVALDYTITYEKSPPTFRAPVLQYSSNDDGTQAVTSENTDEAKFTMQTGTLQGRIDQDATALLDQTVGSLPDSAPITIDCSKLIAIDFAAAGSVLNWAALQQSKGRVVVFNQLHRLIAIFFNVIGINEHAKVVPRKN
ncbi:STAS domain-containing protein [Lampropedia puyangensis]|uniref:STAS domain-containing protein n=1 Tax=Lampropedia puyangensis TaxID=1330072 RepID=A0A4S8ET63_9BURK|nr:STAS domain-containing protein [Lampropedia puyangensis]THT95461.1 STAS domain-containing protein [Lampropedia puyangensis]